MAKSLFDKVKDRQGQLEDLRRSHEKVWSCVIDYVRPEITRWYAESDNAAGGDRNQLVYSGVPNEALSNWADGMQGHTVSASLPSPWFGYEMENKELNLLPEVIEYNQANREAMLPIFRDSEFYPSLSPLFRDAGSTGDTTLWMDKGRESNGPLIDFKTFHPRELYHARNVFHRKFKMTAMNAVETFGKENLSETVQRNYTQAPFTRTEFVHACYRKTDPIFEGETGLPKREWISLYIELASTTVPPKPLLVEGYHSKPYARWTYAQSSDSEYGWGLGCDALVFITQLNAVAKTNTQQQQLAVDPPVLAHENLRGRLRLRPHGRTYTKNMQTDTVVPILGNPNIQAGLTREEAIQVAIERVFNIDFFLMLARAEKPLTATEVIERTAEKAVLLGPKLWRLERHLLTPVHDRAFRIAGEAGKLPDPPDVLLEEGNDDIGVEYLGPLALAQKQAFQVRQNELVFQSIGQLAQINPNVTDLIDTDIDGRRRLRVGDYPQTSIRSEQEVAAMREQRAKEQQALQAAEQAAQAADAIPKLSKPIEEGSPLALAGENA